MHISFCIMLFSVCATCHSRPEVWIQLIFKTYYLTVHIMDEPRSPDFLLWKGHILCGCGEFKWCLVASDLENALCPFPAWLLVAFPDDGCVSCRGATWTPGSGWVCRLSTCWPWRRSFSGILSFSHACLRSCLE